MQLRWITDQNRKEMLNALAWLCILPFIHVCGGERGGVCMYTGRRKHL